MREFFQCVAEAVVENGIQGLAHMVPGGPFVYAVGESAFKKYKERRRVQQQQADFQQLANAKIDEIRVELVEIVNEVAARVPAGHNVAAPTDDEIIDLVQYLTGIPEALRQSLKRAEDPTGTTVPQNFAVNSAEDIVKVLPPRPPRFRPGMCVPNRPGRVLERLLGMGGFGEVWYARDTRINSFSGAIKFCFGQTGRDLIHEADLINRVMEAGSHPNIVPLTDIHLDGDTPWLQFEYVSGGSLTDWIHSLAGMTNDARLPQVVAAIRQLAGAIGFFHSLPHPIAHRDLKPSNILLDAARKRLRITDFGIGSVTAKETNRQERTGQSTRGGRLLSYLRGSHTPIYSSPQQRRGDAPDPRDDVHALGVIAYQMLTGKLDSGPGTGATHALKRMAVADEVADLILRCASEELDDRPATATAFMSELNELGKAKAKSEPEPIALQPVAPPPPPRIAKPVLKVLNAGNNHLGNIKPAPIEVYPVVSPRPPIAKPVLKDDDLKIPLPGGLSMAFSYCPPGNFRMGGSAYDIEKPVHTVTLTKGFYAGVFPVTQEQYQAVVGTNPSHFKGPKRPVEKLNWSDSQEFCVKLSKLCGREIRLPTEAEWEYFCRAGSTTDYCNGDDEAALHRVGWCDSNSYREAHSVGELLPNAWNLCDCHGNVWEWCLDWYDENAYQRGDCQDPTGPKSGSYRVLRGGSWSSTATGCRSANRYWGVPSDRSRILGLRCAAGLS